MKTWIPIKKIAAVGVLLCLGILGCVMAVYSTRWGPYLTGDSIVYMQGAKNMLAGNGYATLLGRGEIRPITAFPPMTSVALAITNFGLADMVVTGRWLNIVLMGINVFLSGWIVLRYSRSILAAVFASGLVVTQLAVLESHTGVMSEGLFVTFMLLTLWTLAEFFDKDKRWMLLLSGLFLALSVLTRYVGIALVPIGAGSLLLLERKRWKYRLRDVLLWGVAALIPVALWLLRNQLVADTTVSRSVGLHLMAQNMRGALGDQILSWFYLTELGLPWRVRIPLFVLLFAAAAVWFVVKDKSIFGIRNSAPRPLSTLPYLLIALLPVYVFVIWANTSFLDSSTGLGAIRRYLVPVFVTTAIMMVCVAFRLIEISHKKALAASIGILFGVGLIVYYGLDTTAYLFRLGDETGYGYTDNINYWPNEIAALKGLDTSRPIITNDPELLYALCERYSYRIPYIRTEDGGTSVDMATVRKWMGEGAYLIIITRFGQELEDVFDANLMAGYPDPMHIQYLFIYFDPAYTP